MKKTFLLHILFMLFISMNLHAQKKSFGDGLYWEVTPTGELIISGYGATPNYTRRWNSGKFMKVAPPWDKKREQIRKITVMEGITSLGTQIFSRMYKVEEVTLPLSLKEIREFAIDDDVNISSIVIPNSVTSIGRSAFSGCEKLENVVLSENIVTIPEGAFCLCKSLKSINIPKKVTSIEKRAFEFSSLTEVSFPKNLRFIGSEAFNLCPLERIIIPDNIERIGWHAFSLHHCLTLSISQSVKEIAEGAFGSAGDVKNPQYRIECLPQFIIDRPWKYGIELDLTRLYSQSIRDSSGKIILEASKNRTIQESHGVYVVNESGRISIVDKNGKVVIPATRKYDAIYPQDGYYLVLCNKKQGVCNLAGEEVVRPQYTSMRWSEDQDVWRVEDGESNGLLDKHWRVIISTAHGYTGIREITETGTKYYEVFKNRCHGLMDANGKQIIPAEMQDIKPIGSGFFKFEINGFWGVADNNGKTIIPTSRGYTYIGNYISSIQRFPYSMNGYKGECDKQGRQITKISTASSKPSTPSSFSTNSASSSSSSTNVSSNLVVDFEYFVYATYSNGRIDEFLKHGDSNYTQFIIRFDLKTSSGNVIVKLLSVDKKTGNRQTVESYEISPSQSYYNDEGGAFALEFYQNGQRKIINVNKTTPEKSVLIADAQATGLTIMKGKRFTPISTYEALSPAAIAMLKGVVDGYNNSHAKANEKILLEPENFDTKYSQLKTALARYRWKQ